MCVAYFIAIKWLFDDIMYYFKYIIYLCSSYIVDNASFKIEKLIYNYI